MKHTERGIIRNRISLLIITCMLGAMGFSPALGQNNNDRISGTNTDYRVGDWISYSNLKYVHHVAVGMHYIYTATTGGIGRFDRYKEQWTWPWTVSNGLADNYVTAVGYDADTSFLWAATSTAVSYLHPASQVWTNIFIDEMGFRDTDRVTSIGFDNSYVWLEINEKWLMRGNKTFGNFLPATATEATNVKWNGARIENIDEIGYYLVEGPYFFDESGFLQDYNLRQFEITSYITDQWQNGWIGTWGLGVARADLQLYKMSVIQNGLLQQDASIIAKNGRELWIGGFGETGEVKGVTEWDSETKWNYYEAQFEMSFQSDNINAIEVDEENVWLGTDQGLVWYDRTKNSWNTFSRTDLLPDIWVNDVVTDDENVWVATAKGVTHFNKQSMSTDSMQVNLVQWPALANIEVYDLDLMHNLVWMGTEYGIYVYDAAGDSGGFYSGPDGPFDRAITAVSRNGDEVWFGTHNGVEAFDVGKKEWLSSPARQYGTGISINRILADEEAVWAVSDSGVLKFDRSRHYWRRFTKHDGLVDNRVKSVVLDGEYIWFGTPSGITRFYWDSPHRID